MAATLRAIVMIAYQSALWYPDSIAYLQTARRHSLGYVRPSGYPAFLAILHPLRSVMLILLLQHLIGLGMGSAIYALLRHRGLPGWGATLPALPVLFDGFQLQLEHMLMSDTLFIAIVVAVTVLLCWNDRPGIPAAAVAGALLGYAALVRPVGLPLLAVVSVCLLARRTGWRAVAALAVAGVLPVAAYVTDFHAQHETFAISYFEGLSLYDRVMSFANCAKIRPPASLADLCDPRPQSEREQPPLEYIWDHHDPIYRLELVTLRYHHQVHHVRTDLFTARINSLAEQFARRAIAAQPLSYLRAVSDDTLRSFDWGNPVPYDFINKLDLFPPQLKLPPRALAEIRRYQPGVARPRVVRPLADFLVSYQRWVYLRGTLLGLILLIGLAGIAARWRRLGGPVLLPWTTATALLAIPPITLGYNMRFVLAAVPFACLAAGIAATRQRSRSATQ